VVRTLKPAAVRKKEILDAALSLFMVRGYGGTSVNDILAATGLSKGAFYHHFASKEVMLEALVQRMGDDGLSYAEQILADAAPSSAARLNAFFRGGNRYQIENAAKLRSLIQVMGKDENLRLRLRAQEHLVEAIIPILTRVLAEGKHNGELTIDDPSETARVLLHLGTLINEAFATGMRMADRRAAMSVCRTRIRTCEQSIERLLGLPPASFEIVSPDLVEAFFAIGDEVLLT